MEVDAVAFRQWDSADLQCRPTLFLQYLQPRTHQTFWTGRSLRSFVFRSARKFSESRLKDVVEQTEKALQDAGYFGAIVTSTLGPDNPRHLRTVALDADVHGKATIESVRIQGGDGVLTPAQLRDALDISAGDVFNAAQLDKGLAAIRKLLSDKSFLNTPVTADPAYNASTKHRSPGGQSRRRAKDGHRYRGPHSGRRSPETHSHLRRRGVR